MESKDNCMQQPCQMDDPSARKSRLVDIVVRDENTALNLLVSFVSLANKRGAFTLDESAKIWECVKMFQKEDM